MKKIFTLLFCTVLVSAAFAQDDHRNWNNGNDNYAYRDRNYNNDQYRGDREHDQFRDDHGDRDQDRNFRDRDQRGYGDHDQFRNRGTFGIYFTYQNFRYGFDKRDAVVARIAAYYDNQVQRVANNCFMNRWEKRRAINDLNDQKEAEINSIYSQCNNASYPRGY